MAWYDKLFSFLKKPVEALTGSYYTDEYEMVSWKFTTDLRYLIKLKNGYYYLISQAEELLSFPSMENVAFGSRLYNTLKTLFRRIKNGFEKDKQISGMFNIEEYARSGKGLE